MIHLYWKNASPPAVAAEHGVDRGELESIAEALAHAHAGVCRELDAGDPGYARMLASADCRDQVLAVVRRCRPKTSDLVVLGIGGSALGNIALHTALNPVCYNLSGDRGPGSPRLFVLDNVDPALVADTLDLVLPRLETTLVNVISKSGETAETASQFLILREMLRDRLGADYAKRIVATTDPRRGTLHDVAEAEGYQTLPVPANVGGRFSVLSPVGLFSAAMCGIDIDALLAGARKMAERLRLDDPMQNPACVLAGIKFLMMTRKGKCIHVMMPYSNRLYSLADWYRQLWAESLGKTRKTEDGDVYVGATPVKALGATDQHSQIQLYREGPNDKLIVFLAAARHPADVTVPAALAGVPGLAYLGGKSLSDLLRAEKVATEYALHVSDRPSVTLRFDAIDPESVGAFIFFYEFVTSLMGRLLKVDPYDQPAVELGKKATFAQMGRAGYEDLAAEIGDFDRTDEAFLL